MPPIRRTFVAVFQFVRHIIIIYVTRHRNRAQHYHNSSATHFVNIQCIILNRPQLVYFVIVTHSENKTPFLHFKNHTFVHQKPPFWRAKRGFLLCKKGGLHNKNEQPEKPLPVATMPNTHTPPHNNTTHSAHAYA